MKRSRDIFRMKRFEISNKASAMRVGTDGVMLGAWAPVGDTCREVWDAGAGTGLISLMIAQRAGNVTIDGIEIDPVAAEECGANFASSPWSDRLRVTVGDISDVAARLTAPDLIVSNPPFFTNGAKAPAERRAAARHADSLGPLQLLHLAARYLRPGGRLAMIAPSELNDEIIYGATVNGLEPAAMADIVSREGRVPFRRMWLLCRREEKQQPLQSETIIIRDAEGSFTPRYIELTKDYYLDF